MQKPTLGRIVLYAFLNDQKEIVERPADVVAIFNPTAINLQVKLDGPNDRGLLGVTPEDVSRMGFWATSIAPADDHAIPQAGRWRWPPRE